MATKLTTTMSMISHQGRDILFADYADLRGDELVAELAANKEAILKLGRSGRRDLLVLTDVTTATIGTDVLNAFKDIAKAMKPYTRASAVVGMTTARKFMLQTVNLFSSLPTEPVDTVEDGKSWLVAQAKG